MTIFRFIGITNRSYGSRIRTDKLQLSPREVRLLQLRSDEIDLLEFTNELLKFRSEGIWNKAKTSRVRVLCCKATHWDDSSAVYRFENKTLLVRWAKFVSIYCRVFRSVLSARVQHCSSSIEHYNEHEDIHGAYNWNVDPSTKLLAEM